MAEVHKLNDASSTHRKEHSQSKESEEKEESHVIAQFRMETGETTGPLLDLPISTSTSQLETLINHLLNNEEKQPYSFFINDVEITGDLVGTFLDQKLSTEDTLFITYQPQAVFRVRPVTRCSASMSGHSEAVLCVQFSPDASLLCTGSGDTTVRFWDPDTQTPLHSCKGHTNWVLYVSWSPDGKKVASGGMDTSIRLWDPVSGKQLGSPLKGHSKYITAIAWEPFHMNVECIRMCSASKDCTIKIWDTRLYQCILSLSSHTMSVTSVKWGGEGLIYSGSQDRTIKVWDAKDGKLCRTLEGHAHWVNTLALNTDYVLRTGTCDHTNQQFKDKEEARKYALERYLTVIKTTNNHERLLSGSDDFTMYLWEPAVSKKAILRMTGHQQLINVVAFSPDGRYIASGSFDKSIKLWSGSSGKFITTLRGHVESVYQLSWSPDSRMLVSASKDSTLKVWDTKSQKLKFDLPGHADEVYAVDWCTNRVASGSKDRLVKLWQN